MAEREDPAAVFSNPRNPRPEELIPALADTKIFTKRQAEVYVHREIEAVPRKELAENLGYDSPSSLDSVHQAAKNNLADAEWVTELIEHYRNPPLPSECDQCGGTLGGSWISTDAGDVYCSQACADAA